MLTRPLPVMLDVVEEHFDELAWLWEHRQANVFTPDWTLVDLAEHEARCEAHLDGLRVAGWAGTDVAENALDGDDESEATAAALLLLEDEDEGFALVTAAFLSGPAAAVSGIGSAARHQFLPWVQSGLTSWIDHDDPMRAAAALDGLAFNRAPVEVADRLLHDPNHAVRELAVASAGRLGTFDDSAFTVAMQDEAAGVRRLGLEAAARVGLPGLLDWCRAQSSADTGHTAEAIEFLAIVGDRSDVALIQSRLEDPVLAPTCIDALGRLGYLDCIPTLVELASDAELGFDAMEAYRALTGATDIEGERPVEPVGADDDADEAPDERLPPDPALIARDWNAREGSLDPQFRWHSGIQFRDDQPPPLDALPLHLRRDSYLRLRARFGNRLGDVELEAMVRRQRRELESLAGGGR